MDDADRADSRIQRTIDEGIARVRAEKDRYLPSIGVCHWCESPVGAGRVFCSKECSEDHEHDRIRRKAAGL